MAGRPSKFPKPETASAEEVERTLEIAELDEAMALRYYPEQNEKQADFLEFLRALRPGTPNPRSNTRAVHVYFYDEALKALFEGWKELVDRRQIRQGDSMSRTVGMMVIEYVRLAKEEKEIHWENMRARMGRVPQPSPEGDQTESSSPTADPETAD